MASRQQQQTSIKSRDQFEIQYTRSTLTRLGGGVDSSTHCICMTRFLVILFVTQGTDESYICEAARLLTMEDLGSFYREMSENIKKIVDREIPEFKKFLWLSLM